MRKITALHTLHKSPLLPVLRSRKWIVVFVRQKIVYIYYKQADQTRLNCFVADVNLLYGIRRLASGLTIFCEGDKVRLIRYYPEPILKLGIMGKVAGDSNGYVGVHFSGRPELVTRVDKNHSVFDAIEKVSND